MASRRSLLATSGAAVLVLMALAWGAGATSGSPRLQVLCVLALSGPAWLLWRALTRLGRAPAAAPAPAAREHPPALGQPGSAVLLEARLEHAPVALFLLEPGGAQGVSPLNANARRLLAPGRVVDAEAVCALLAAQPASGRALIAFDTERGTERFMSAVSSMTVEGRAQRVAALLPVESELESETLNAWRQLVQVLTHEIMNSLTPVASLSNTALGLLHELQPRREGVRAGAGDGRDEEQDQGQDQDQDQVVADLALALDAIARRAASLADFVGSYRSLSALPQAHPQQVGIQPLLERVSALIAPAWRARGGELRILVEPASLVLVADPGQIEQALINLLKNAAEATAGLAAPQATLHARLVRGARLQIEVSDNGPGVPEELLAHIFTPFFTTKKGGRGIGLALVRQLVHGNGGTVRHVRPVAGGARFVLGF